MPWYRCSVNEVGPAADGTETSVPVIYINLSDTGNPPAFAGQWFYAQEGAQNQMLAVALAALNGNKKVQAAALSAPGPGNTGFIEIQRLYLLAS
jgi:hypothetical protein